MDDYIMSPAQASALIRAAFIRQARTTKGLWTFPSAGAHGPLFYTGSGWFWEPLHRPALTLRPALWRDAAAADGGLTHPGLKTFGTKDLRDWRPTGLETYGTEDLRDWRPTGLKTYGTGDLRDRRPTLWDCQGWLQTGPGQSRGSMGRVSEVEVSEDELECKICYSHYDLFTHRPKLLECCHTLCSKCLRKIVDVGDAFPREAVCPFCRYPTSLRGNSVSDLPDNLHLLSALSMHPPAQRNIQVTTELLLSPHALTSLVGHNSTLAPSLSSSSSSGTFSSLGSSPGFVLITIMEPRPLPRLASSLDSLVSMSRGWAALLWRGWARVLLWALGLVYFSSLPVGVYLLLLHRPTMGVLMVSLVPASLALVMGYGLCQCVWHELRHCLSDDSSSLNI
ncbi:unnamed protein product [Knipowitschia caucasica]|uniref:E3 ubiquitin-protein ligase RNF182 n=1 Tax=Knipowitschia caucasica TaxID=637954 RepID=A0AAV2JXC2_KNICA